MSTAVITGIGVVAPSGIGLDAHWSSLLAGELAVRRIEAFDPALYATTIAGQVDGFDVTEHVDGRLVVQTDRWTWMSLAATQMALDDASYDPAAYDPFDTSVALAAGSGGNAFGQKEMTGLYKSGPRAVGAYQSIAWFYAASTGQSSIRHGTKGPASVLVTDGAGVRASDAVEAAALREVFGAGQVAVTAPQGLVGRLNVGGAALSVATALLAIRENVVPPVGNLDGPGPAYGLDLVTTPRETPVDVVLVNARGFGGFNSSMVLKRVAA